LAPYTSKWKSKFPNIKTRDGFLAKFGWKPDSETGLGIQNYYGGYPMGMGGMGMGGMGMGYGMPMGGMGMGMGGMYPGMGMGMGGMYPQMMGGMGGYGVGSRLTFISEALD
jgi:hypothetical protein